MKLNLDCDTQDMGMALNLAFRVMSQNPNQETGSEGALRVRAGSGATFEFVKNEDSYTMRAI